MRCEEEPDCCSVQAVREGDIWRCTNPLIHQLWPEAASTESSVDEHWRQQEPAVCPLLPVSSLLLYPSAAVGEECCRLTVKMCYNWTWKPTACTRLACVSAGACCCPELQISVLTTMDGQCSLLWGDAGRALKRQGSKDHASEFIAFHQATQWNHSTKECVITITSHQVGLRLKVSFINLLIDGLWGIVGICKMLHPCTKTLFSAVSVCHQKYVIHLSHAILVTGEVLAMSSSVGGFRGTWWNLMRHPNGWTLCFPIQCGHLSVATALRPKSLWSCIVWHCHYWSTRRHTNVVVCCIFLWWQQRKFFVFFPISNLNHA